MRACAALAEGRSRAAGLTGAIATTRVGCGLGGNGSASPTRAPSTSAFVGNIGSVVLCSKGHRYLGEACPVCGERRPGRRPKTAARGYGGAWQRLSLLARQCQPWCSVCGTSADLTADHRDPRSKGRADLTLADVVVLCRRCNSRKGRSRAVFQ
jgi:HNH endonuclease